MENSDTFRHQSRELSIDDMLDIADALLKCPSIQNTLSRKSVLELLNEDKEFQGIVNRVERSSDDLTDVTRIVQTCLKWRGSLEQLVRIVRRFDRGSDPAQNLRILVHKRLISYTIDVQRFDELMDLFVQIQPSIRITKEKLQYIYCSSLPSIVIPNVTIFQKEQYNIIQILSSNIRELAWFPWQQDGTHPLLTYIEGISKYVLSPLKEQLTQWRSQFDQNMPIGRVPQTRSNISLQGDFFLLVTLQPDIYEPERFSVSAHLVREENGKSAPVGDGYGEEATHLLKDIPALLGSWVRDCEGRIAYNSQFTIELFLPFGLLAATKCDPHQWELQDQYGNSTSLSQEHPIVVRSYDRVYQGNVTTWQAWKRNWDICQSGECCLKTFASSQYSESDGMNANRAKPCFLHEKGGYHSGRKDLHISLRKVGCLRMTFVPPGFDNTQPHIFKKMLGAGTSVALWLRPMDKIPDIGTLEKIYCKLLPDCNILGLPTRIWEQRQEGELSPANHITLFWDDPNRVPAGVEDPLIAPKGSKS